MEIPHTHGFSDFNREAMPNLKRIAYCAFFVSSEAAVAAAAAAAMGMGSIKARIM